jgi:pantoate--beta-alanine ligase
LSTPSTPPALPRVITEPGEMTAWSNAARARGERIVFVPTMGALHTGHVALAEEGRRRGQALVVSIFVNPTQFGPNEDLARYPRTLPRDRELCAGAGVDIVFAPTAAAMYPPGYQTFIEVREISRGMDGDRRPGHFVGVATVVTKLFLMVRPDEAIFGEKDFQQLAVIRQMTLDLNLGIDIIAHPTIREPDGLAMSSRNTYLSPADRQRAPAIYRALSAARAAAAAGEKRAAVLIDQALATIRPAVDSIDYVEIRDATTLTPLPTLDRPAVMLVAAFVGTTRLIDNLRL